MPLFSPSRAGDENGALGAVTRGLRRAGLPLTRDAPLVPAKSIAGRSLVTVIAIMSFLCALTAGAGLLVAGASRDWQRSVAAEITIQVRPLTGRDVDTEVGKAASIVRDTAGVTGVEVYDKAASERLLEPWLGTGLNLNELPVPRMVAVRLDKHHPPDLRALRQTLESAVAGVSLDDHQVWFAWLSTMANTVVGIAVVLFCLMLAAMFLTVAFATRGAMAGNHEIITVLHFVGAEDRFIAREFQRHFLRLGLRGGAIGGGAAVLSFLVAGTVKSAIADTAGGDQLDALFGTFTLGLRGYGAIALVMLSIAIATGLVSRFIVRRSLEVLQ